jgi:RNA polymerase sigma factor (sigma-70 family)
VDEHPVCLSVPIDNNGDMETSVLRRHRAALPRSRRLLAALGDDRLVEQIRRGNDVAFEVAYDRHHRGILAFCRHMLGSQEEAEDAVQQTFASAYADLRSNDRDMRLKAWLYTIARNRCLSILRARREQPAELDDQPTAGLSEQVERRADLRELLDDLRGLPAEQREALVLFELGDLSQTEVAGVIGVEPMKVKALVFQARATLIENRDARAVPCAEIREELATATGGALRRGRLRRHLKACSGCREYRDQVSSQRRALALVLPVVPTLGLKEAVLATLGVGGGGGGAGGAGLAASGAAGGGWVASIAGAGGAKLALTAVVAGGTLAGGGLAVERAVHRDSGSSRAQAAEARGSASGTRTTVAGAPTPRPATAMPIAGGTGEGSRAGTRDDRGQRKRRKRRDGRSAAAGEESRNGSSGDGQSRDGESDQRQAARDQSGNGRDGKRRGGKGRDDTEHAGGRHGGRGPRGVKSPEANGHRDDGDDAQAQVQPPSSGSGEHGNRGGNANGRNQGEGGDDNRDDGAGDEDKKDRDLLILDLPR